uniref:Uncharacterized protein n=1 Tax=Arundo donax TaxID=35708 RepID=A0A0A8YPT5_ARUDO
MDLKVFEDLHSCNIEIMVGHTNYETGIVDWFVVLFCYVPCIVLRGVNDFGLEPYWLTTMHWSFDVVLCNLGECTGCVILAWRMLLCYLLGIVYPFYWHMCC